MGVAAVMALSKNFKIIITLIILAVFIGGIALAAQGAPKTKKSTAVAGQVTIVIERSLGVYYITLNNLNEETGDFVVSQFPYNFTTTAGDEIQQTGTPKEGYKWSGWLIIKDGSTRFVAGNNLDFLSDNNLYVDTATNTITIQPQCLRLNPTPTPTSTPTITQDPLLPK
jgi:hypothetical protein